MDQKQPSNQLDPKLKEAYERVMGTMPAASIPPQPAVTAPIASMPQTVTSPTGSLIHETPANAQTTSPGMPTLLIPSTPSLTNPAINAVPQISSNPLMNTWPAHAISPQPIMPSSTQPVNPMLPTNPMPIKQLDMKPVEQIAQVTNHIAQATPPLLGNKLMEPMHATMPLSTTTPVHTPTAQIHGFVAPKKKSGISPLLLILGGVVFVIVYTLVWIKVFNISLPFLGK